MLAKKFPSSQVLLLELQRGLHSLAKKNIALNELGERVSAVRCNLCRLSSPHIIPGTFDLVVSNPPFRQQWSGRINVEEEKAIARHEIMMRLRDVVRAASFMLRARGRFCMVYHPGRLAELTGSLREGKLEPKRMRFIHSDESADAKMVLIEAVKEGRAGLMIEKPFFIYTRQREYTDEMRRIYHSEHDVTEGLTGDL